MCAFSEHIIQLPPLASDQLFSVVVWSLRHVWLFANPRTVARQAPLSRGCPWQEHWGGLAFPYTGVGWHHAPSARGLVGYHHSHSLGSLHLGKPQHAVTPDPCRQLLTMCVCSCACVCVCMHTHACSTSTPARSSFLRPSVTLRGRLPSDSARSWLGACPNGPQEWNNTSLSTYHPDVSRYCHVCG